MIPLRLDHLQNPYQIRLPSIQLRYQTSNRGLNFPATLAHKQQIRAQFRLAIDQIACTKAVCLLLSK